METKINEIRTELLKITQFLFGIDGRNGLRGNIKEIEKTVDDTEKRITQLEKAQARWLGYVAGIALATELAGILLSNFLK